MRAEQQQPQYPQWAQRAQPPGGRRVSLVAVVVVVAVLAGSAAAGYAVTRNLRGETRLVKCGALQCLPSLKSAEVLTNLKAKGFACKSLGGLHTDWDCELSVGDTIYRATIEDVNGLIGELSAAVVAPPGSKPVLKTINYLMWFAGLPYADDPVTVGEVRGWLSQQLSAGKQGVNATLGDFRYQANTHRVHGAQVSFGVSLKGVLA